MTPLDADRRLLCNARLARTRVLRTFAKLAGLKTNEGRAKARDILEAQAHELALIHNKLWP